MLLSIIAVGYIIKTGQSLRYKTEATLDKLHDGAINFGEAGLNIGSFVSQFTIFKRKKSVGSTIGTILKKLFE